ncbi:hypothetical protein FTO68_01045 [Methanocalculus taiwanensis]|uniref:Transglutaminase-like domain-containing protein n=1 Tax=Methanocalculus taiwanensis TaxID=106207 RepID=A0ABD4TGE3_9EURY|nr:hypothetical protein [Methanocalculus taiwanensis]MCQ1537581.1 hypothetical protein [Methanocalculus taiwanensis]
MLKDEIVIVIAGIAVVLIISLVVQQPSLPWQMKSEENGVIPTDIYYETPGTPGYVTQPPGQPTWVVSQLPVDDETPPYSPKESIQLKTRDTAETYRWYSGGSYYTWTIQIPASRYNYFAILPRDKPGPEDYVMSDRGRAELHLIIEDFISLAASRKLNENQRRDLIISFVQSLPNNHWGAVRDYDDYPKYPLQTLYDGGGDSQDTTILLASLLNLLNYQASLFETPRHYAVLLPLTEADKANNLVYVYQKDANTILKGNYLDEDNNIRDYYQNRPDVIKSSYVYIESNIPGYPIGTLPAQFRSVFVQSLYDVNYHPMRPIEGAAILNPIRTPDADLRFNARLIHYDQLYAYYQIYCTITSTGTGIARDLNVAMTARPAHRTDTSWIFSYPVPVPAIPEGETRFIEGTVQIPRNSVAEIECILSGPGITPKERVSETFSS